MACGKILDCVNTSLVLRIEESVIYNKCHKYQSNIIIIHQKTFLYLRKDLKISIFYFIDKPEKI